MIWKTGLQAGLKHQPFVAKSLQSILVLRIRAQSQDPSFWSLGPSDRVPGTGGWHPCEVSGLAGLLGD